MKKILLTGCVLILVAWGSVVMFQKADQVARPMTRADVDCDANNFTITLHPGIYNTDIMEAVKLCGWINHEGNIFINGNQTTVNGVDLVP